MGQQTELALSIFKVKDSPCCPQPRDMVSICVSPRVNSPVKPMAPRGEQIQVTGVTSEDVMLIRVIQQAVTTIV